MDFKHFQTENNTAMMPAYYSVTNFCPRLVRYNVVSNDGSTSHLSCTSSDTHHRFDTNVTHVHISLQWREPVQLSAELHCYLI